MFKKIWADPVWSKVIANGIIVILGFIIVVIYSSATNMTAAQAFSFVWSYPVKLGNVFLCFLFISVFQILVSIIKSKNSKPSKEWLLKKNFCEKWYKISDDQNNIIYRFKTGVNNYTDKPFITDLTPYCKHDGEEIKMSFYKGCMVRECSNYNVKANEFAIRDLIESQLMVDWEKVNGKY